MQSKNGHILVLIFFSSRINPFELGERNLALFFNNFKVKYIKFMYELFHFIKTLIELEMQG